MSDYGLPEFESGAPLARQLSASVMNALRDRISRNTPLAGNGIRTRQTEAGTIIEINRQPLVLGAYDNPYLLGSRGYGSSTAGAATVIGSSLNWGSATPDAYTPWGGSADTAAAVTVPYYDQWHRDRPPLDSSNHITMGGKVSVMTRILHNSGDNYYVPEMRACTFDSRGALVLVDVESPASGASNYSTRIRAEMHPWQCYITALASNSCSVKINPNSTLMQTWDYRTYWKDALWKDAWTHSNITNFTNTFVLTASTHCVWMEVEFTAGDITAVAIKNGAAWNADLRYVSADNGVLGTGSFTWYQLLAYFKPSGSGDGGSEVDAVFSGVNYKLMCPTTTHLMQSYVMGSIYPYADPFNPEAHFAIIPWHGCWFPTS
jgi:hypothetical protein